MKQRNPIFQVILLQVVLVFYYRLCEDSINKFLLSDDIQVMHDLSRHKKNRVATLLSYYDGEKYIVEQLNSILSQEPNVEIWISNDGDANQTHSLQQKLSLLGKRNNIHLLDGPKAGYAKNFLSLVSNSKIKAEYYAFADQDDIWDKNKLSRAISWLNTIPVDCPACYCSRTRLTDEVKNEIGFSPLYKRKPSFKNALVQSIAGGNTMVINDAARTLLAKTKDATIVSHDWWAYLLITGAGGKFFYDPYPTIRYRQHTKNLVGSNSSLKAKYKRLIMLLNNRFRNWNDINCKALEQYIYFLTPENRETFDAFSKGRSLGLLKRVVLVRKSGVYRQTWMGNLSFIFATILKKI